MAGESDQNQGASVILVGWIKWKKAGIGPIFSDAQAHDKITRVSNTVVMHHVNANSLMLN